MSCEFYVAIRKTSPPYRLKIKKKNAAIFYFSSISMISICMFKFLAHLGFLCVNCEVDRIFLR